ncbi:tail fiber domain-containing protein [Arcticibacterium luteifluviistationis]|uniref:Peptidase S74 domain-containing protein n=1 Tax=Arcticibacterium luteifluviistationis TaxID=1784714 RepID=A0A2Z4G9V6_9BACT|nr:tail fiber domain-containing protein [Arcticibacterium luteifluviistationis]AWV98019.1 hypothetical protein DJ013_07475 [Arcticibacterium luteifluviistationis]
MRKVKTLLAFILVPFLLTAQSVLITPGAQSINGDSTTQKQLNAFGNGLLVGPKVKFTDEDPASNVHIMDCGTTNFSNSLAGTLKDPNGDSDYLSGFAHDCDFYFSTVDPLFLAYQIDFEVLDTEAAEDTVFIMNSFGTTVLASYSGNSLPPSLRVLNNSVLIRFKTNSTVVGAGFVLTWKAILRDEMPVPIQNYSGEGIVYDVSSNSLWAGRHNPLDFENKGGYSTALGYNSKAIGSVSTALGSNSTASGFASTAMGEYTEASGNYSTAMGEWAKASGNYSTAMGLEAIASGNSSTAMGLGTIASGTYSTAMGRSTIASGNSSTAMGRGTEANTSYSTAMGYNTKARGYASTAMGELTEADTSYATAMGYFSKASGYSSTAMGEYTEASGNSSTAMGYNTEASGKSSTAMGYNTKASGNYSTTMGRSTRADTIYATAMGFESVASGYSSTAMGQNTAASGYSSTAMGLSTVASGDYSTAIGSNTTASSSFSTSMGASTTASGLYSTSMGQNTFASGIVSTAMGDNTTASGDFSTAIGRDVTSNGVGTFTIGDSNPGSGVLTIATDNQFVGRFYNGYYLLTSQMGDPSRGVRINHDQTAWSSISDSTKKENFIPANGDAFLGKLKDLKLGSWNYKINKANPERFYGPMAQEIYAAYGKDAKGTIGSDTLVSTLNMDGLLFIFAQELEKRTTNLKEENNALKSEIDALKEKYDQNVVANKHLKNDFEQRISQLEKLLTVKSEGDLAKLP